MSVPDVVAEVGLWWPAADQDDLRTAAAAWDRTAAALDHAVEVGGDGLGRARAHWDGAAADRFERSWRAHEQALRDDAAGSRALASALRRYADAVADAQRRVEELAVTAGATIVAGLGLAWLTFGTSAAAAAGVSAALVAAAEAIGVELSATAASIIGGSIAFGAVGAGEAAVVDTAVTQPVRVGVFHDGAFSGGEVAGAAVTGGVVGGGVGGVLGRTAVATGATAPSAASDLGELDGVITAALDPGRRGALGPLFRAGVHESPPASFTPDQLPAARLLGSEGRSVHVRVEPTGPGALVRSSRADPGRLTELVRPEAGTADAVENAILEAGGRLARHGSGDLVLDGRAAGLDVDAAGEGLSAAVDRATAHGLALPDEIRFVFDGGSIHYP